MSKFIHGPAVAGQSVVDRVLAAKHTVAGQSLAKVICKATTEEVMGPKRKHIDCMLTFSFEHSLIFLYYYTLCDYFSIRILANALFEVQSCGSGCNKVPSASFDNIG